MALSIADSDGDQITPPHRETFRIASQRCAEVAGDAEVTLQIDWGVGLQQLGRHTVTAAIEGERGTTKHVSFDVRLQSPNEPVISEEEQNFFDEEMGLI